MREGTVLAGWRSLSVDLTQQVADSTLTLLPSLSLSVTLRFRNVISGTINICCLEQPEQGWPRTTVHRLNDICKLSRIESEKESVKQTETRNQCAPYRLQTPHPPLLLYTFINLNKLANFTNRLPFFARYLSTVLCSISKLPLINIQRCCYFILPSFPLFRDRCSSTSYLFSDPTCIE